MKRSLRFHVGQRVQFGGDDRAKVIDVSSKGDWVQVTHYHADGAHVATKLSKAEVRRSVKAVNPRVTTR